MPAELSSDALSDAATAGASPTTPQNGNASPLEEYKIVETLIAKPLKAGGSYFLVNRRWYTEWLQWVGHPIVQSPKVGPAPEPMISTPERLDDSLTLDGPQEGVTRARTGSWTKDRPGQIDNTELLEEGSTNDLKRTLDERSDYEIIPEDAWKLIYDWYGGGPPIKRRAIELPSGAVQVELHGLKLKVYKSSDLAGVPLEVTESKQSTVREFKETLCREMGLEPDKVRIWDYFNNRTYALLEKNLDDTLESQRIHDRNPILLDEQDADGNWRYNEDGDDTNASNDYIGSSTGIGYSSSSYTMAGAHSADIPSIGQPVQHGAVGLQNLGNTCFMNSSLQCLSNIPPLREYFLSEDYKENLNPQAHKTQGRLAEAYADLLSIMWKQDTTKVAPRNFKWQIGQFAEQFSGYGQQDSMELIEYVIDGLKEDVNQVRGTKPYVELKEAEGRPDADVAAEALDAYRKRSDSKIDSLFVGLFKSVVRCPVAECGRMSVTFDPFLSAKLPLNSSEEQRQTTFYVTVVRNSAPGDGKSFIEQIKVKVNKDGSAKELVEAAVKEVGDSLEASKCILVEVWNKKVHKFYEDTESVEYIRAEDNLLLCEVADAKAFSVPAEQRWGTSSFSPLSACSGATQSSSSTCGVILHQRQMPAGRTNSSWSYASSRELLSLPLLMSIPRDASARFLYAEVERRIREVVLESGDDELPPWKIYKVDRHSPTSDGELVESESNGELDMRDSREYFAIEWEEGCTLPPRLSQDIFQKGTSGAAANGQVDLVQLLRMFVEDEQLGPDDAWYCNKCKEHKEAWKKLEFHNCPPVMVLQLKRFQYTRWSRERLNNPVNFPIENLDMRPFRTSSSMADPGTEESIYDLAAVSKHIGSLGGGHYVAYARSSVDGEWYYFDDGSVRHCTVSDVEEDKVGAYVLFYIRRDYRPSGFGQPPPLSP